MVTMDLLCVSESVCVCVHGWYACVCLQWELEPEKRVEMMIK